jgi:uncharacterized protein YdhG (YjbR/CyaY superfamily)
MYGVSMKRSNEIDSYISQFPTDVQVLLEKVRKTIHTVAPDAKEAMAYGIPTFKLHNKNLVHFGGYAKHIGFYPTAAGIEAFKKELSEYKGAKGSVQFPLDKPIPYDLISKITLFRVKEVLKKFKD